jgi:hypothetical protein
MSESDGGFSLGLLAEAIERRDADSQIVLYAQNATVQVFAPDHPPQSPMVLRGKPAIASWIHDLCSINMTHQVVDLVDGFEMVAFTEEGRYKDGTRVVSTSTAAVLDGLITRQRVVLVWDGWD